MDLDQLPYTPDMTDLELLQIAKQAGDAMNAWEEYQKQPQAGSTLDSGNVVNSNNREALRAYTVSGEWKRYLLEAVKQYAAERG